MKKNLAQIHLIVFEKSAKKAHFISKNDVPEPEARFL